MYLLPRTYSLNVRKPSFLFKSSWILMQHSDFLSQISIAFCRTEAQGWTVCFHYTHSGHWASLTFSISSLSLFPLALPFSHLFGGQCTIFVLVCLLGYDNILGKPQRQLNTQVNTPIMFLGIFQSLITIKIITIFPVTYWKRNLCFPETVHLIHISTCISKDWCLIILVLFHESVKNFKTITYCLLIEKNSLEYALGIKWNTLTLFYEDNPKITSCCLFLHMSTILCETIWQLWDICFWSFSIKLLK